MAIIVGRSGVVGDIKDEIARLEALITDMRLIADGQGPPLQVLNTAPMVDTWSLCTGQVPCLFGAVHGHPFLSGPLVKTTEIWLLAPELGWARTYSRFYRLGRPLGVEDAS